MVLSTTGMTDHSILVNNFIMFDDAVLMPCCS
jgi:hypothetical protein